MISFASETDIPRTIAVKLLRLRLALAQWLWIDGLRALVWSLVVFCFVDFACDWLIDFDRPQRTICLAAGVSFLVVVAWRRLARPLRQPLPADVLCRVVETRYPGLGERLVTAVQLSRRPGVDPDKVSRRLVRVAIEQGVVAAEAVDFTAVVDARAMRRNLIWLAAAAFVAGGILAGGVYSSTLRIWMQRNLLLRDVHWPHLTRIELVGVTGNVVRVARGDDWEQHVRAHGKRPEWMQIDFRSPAWRSATTESMPQVGDGEFAAIVKQVNSPFQFRVRGGDDASDWIQVELVEKPIVEELSLIATPPEYTRQPATELPSAQGSHEVLAGTTIAIVGRSNQSIADVRLHRVGDSPTGVGDVESLVAHGELDSEGGRTFRLTIASDRLQSGNYAIELTDAVGVRSTSAARFTLRVVPDRAPQIKARLRDVGPLICVSAVLPITVVASDDFAVQSVQLTHTRRREGSDEPPLEGRQTLWPAADADDAVDGRDWSHEFDWSPADLPLAAGMAVSFHFVVEDNNTHDGPNIGRSEDLVVKVVSEDDFRADLLRREKAIRASLETELRNQELLATDVEALLATVGGARQMSSQERQSLASIRRRQQAVRERVIDLAADVERLVRETANNRIEEPSGPIQSRLDGRVATPLGAIAAGSCLNALERLDAARQAADDSAARNDALDRSLDAQRQVATLLRQVIASLTKSAGFQEAVNLLQSILRSQQELHDGTVKANDESLNELRERRP